MEPNNRSGRRAFIKTVGAAGLATCISVPAWAGVQDRTGTQPPGGISWDQKPLGYGFKDIEPAIDAMTMEIHYTKHAAGYTKNLADAVKEENVDVAKTSMEQLLAAISRYSAKMRNNAGGHYNHELFWQTLKAPSADNAPVGKLLTALNKNFGSLDAFKQKFSDAAKTRFGSGWAWLVLKKDGKLEVGSTPNQDNPLMDIAELQGLPLLGLDVWEHAYYLKYQNKRPDYINAWWTAVNWDAVASRI